MAATPLETQQHNERVRTGISVFSNGGLALFGAFSAVLYNGNGSDGALANGIYWAGPYIHVGGSL